MYQSFSFENVLATSVRAAWRLEDVIPDEAKLDFGRPFLPESLARTAEAPGVPDEARLTLNQIRGHEYLSLFGLVEEFILPFILDHARPQLSGDDWRVRALLQFAGEEAKHIQLFRIFQQRFAEAFSVPCPVIGPAEAIAAEVLRHDPLSVALVILQIEWMTQSHYVGSVKDDSGLDPLFKSLLRHHWMEEAQHAKLDTLMVEALAEGRDEAGIQAAVDGYLEIGTFLDNGFRAQAGLNLDALEAATGTALAEEARGALLEQQHQALRWTYLGSGMTHPRFIGTLETLSVTARDRIAAIAPAFC